MSQCLPSPATVKAPIPDATYGQSDLPQDQPEQLQAATAKPLVSQEDLDYFFLHRYKYNHGSMKNKYLVVGGSR